ncbi:MAG: translation initiation factor IF-3 [Bacilli bacterium]
MVNERIRFPRILLIGPNGEKFGEMSRFDAYKKAEEFGLDILCVSPNGNPPVCKLINYGKYRFEAQKKERENKKSQKVIEIKEIQLTPQIGEHDIQTKVKAAIRFLTDGNKIKVGVRFRGRQMSHQEVGQDVLNKFLDYVKDYSIVEKPPVMDGRWLTCVLTSKIKK